jgi:uncharacterized protein YlxW (UPF0749 family)
MDQAEQIARIERMQEETRKFAAEQHKLAAEREKLTADTDKSRLDFRLAIYQVIVPTMAATAALIGATAGLTVAALNFLK